VLFLFNHKYYSGLAILFCLLKTTCVLGQQAIANDFPAENYSTVVYYSTNKLEQNITAEPCPFLEKNENNIANTIDVENHVAENPLPFNYRVNTYNTMCRYKEGAIAIQVVDGVPPTGIH